jgi:hypothetical protein
LHGCAVKVRRSEQRDTGKFVCVEAGNGVASMVAAWMLDPVICVKMVLGTPRVTVSALVELHQLLVERGFGSSSEGDSNIVQEKRRERSSEAGFSSSIGIPTPASAHSDARLDSASDDKPVRAHEGALVSCASVDAGYRRRKGGV